LRNNITSRYAEVALLWPLPAHKQLNGKQGCEAGVKRDF